MHCRRNAVLFTLFGLVVGWGLFAWLVAPDYAKGVRPSVGFHQTLSTALFALMLPVVVYVGKFEDPLDDDLRKYVGERYFECDGLCFMPLVRVAPGEQEGELRAEISLFYENRFNEPCEAVVHLRPRDGAFFSHRGASDVHFAFQSHPGAFGVVHQPVAVRREFQGQPVRVQVAAMTRWPRTHGEQLRSHKGERCGTFEVDWQLAYRQSRHELCGEIELHDPAELTLTMPLDVATDIRRGEHVNETIAEVGV